VAPGGNGTIHKLDDAKLTSINVAGRIGVPSPDNGSHTSAGKYVTPLSILTSVVIPPVGPPVANNWNEPDRNPVTLNVIFCPHH
jgi:hypothetical protein